MTQSMPWQRRSARAGLRLALLGAFALPSACVSLSYTDAQQRRHVIGFVDITLDDAVAPGDTSAVTVTQVGLGVQAGGQGSGLILGYQKDTRVRVPPNACVDLNRPGPCARAVPVATAPATRPGKTPSGNLEKTSDKSQGAIR